MKQQEKEITKTKSTKQSKKRIHFSILVLILTVIFCTICLLFIRTKKEAKEEQAKKTEQEEILKQEEEIKTFLNNANSFSQEITAAKETLYMLGTLYSSDVSLADTFTSIDYFTNLTVSSCSTQISTEKMRKVTIDSLYTELANGPDDDSLSDLKEKIDALYVAYLSAYDLYIERLFTVDNYHDLNFETKKAYDSALSSFNASYQLITSESQTPSN